MGLNDRFEHITDEYNEGLLKDNIEKRFRTSFIGCIASVEDSLGKLWGHGKPEGELTENQYKFRVVWTELRKEILDKGNQEMRRLVEDLDKYRIRPRGRQ